MSQLHKERTAAANRKRLTTHGMSYTRTFRIWSLMLNRCRNPRATQYKYYGGRGIAVCQPWHSFETFYADMGQAPDGKTLDRINSDGNYEKSNCRWATKDQQANNCRSNRVLVVNEERLTMAEASRRWGIKSQTIWQRLRLGWTDADAAMTRPLFRGVKLEESA